MHLKKEIATLATVGLMIGSVGTGLVLTTTTTPVVATASSAQIKLSEQSAVKKFQQRYSNVKLTSLTLEKKFGQYRYELEGYDQSNERSMDINAKTGKVIKTENDQLNSNNQESELKLNNLISRKKANQIASKKVQGSHGIEWTLENKNGQPVWEVVVQKANHETEVTINAQSGKVLQTEKDD